LESHYKTAVDNFEDLVKFVTNLQVLTEEERARYNYNIITLKLQPAYGELPKPETSGASE
jgi:hypothetical protein